MKIGLSIPSRGPLANLASIRALAEKADALDFAHLAVPDHILVPRSIDSDYPYSETGEFPGAAGGDTLEQFTLLAFLAAATVKPQLLSSVAVVPHRGAVHTAKIIATIDVLSKGRMLFGVGAGWMREEFDEEITADSGERQLLSGSSTQIVEDIQALGDLGVTDLVLNFQRGGLQPSLDAMQGFVDDVRSRL